MKTASPLFILFFCFSSLHHAPACAGDELRLRGIVPPIGTAKRHGRDRRG